MRHFAEPFLAHLHDLFAAFGPIATRAMFGGHGVYHDGAIIGIVIDEALYLKADDATRAAFAAAGSAAFVYEGQARPITMSYWSVPEAALESPQAMLPWARRAFEAALRKRAATPPKRGAPRLRKPPAKR